MEGAFGRAIIRLRSWFVIEMAVTVGTAHQHRAEPRLAPAPRMGRYVADPEANTAMGGAVGAGAVHQMSVMQRHLPRSDRHEHAVAPVDFLAHGLAARQKVVRRIGLAVIQLPEMVAARHDLHAAGLDRRVGQGHPGGHLHRRFEAEIGRVLVPADEFFGQTDRWNSRTSGPIRSSTASSTLGSCTISSTQRNNRCGLKLWPLPNCRPSLRSKLSSWSR